METHDTPIINIPAVRQDQRIGSVFNSMFRIINDMENLPERDSVLWDYSGVKFLHPFFVLPLAVYKLRTACSVSTRGLSENLKSYLGYVRFDDMVEGVEELQGVSVSYKNRSYIPICKFDTRQEEEADEVQSILAGIIDGQCQMDSKIKAPLSYMLGELVCNIREHAESTICYIFSQVLDGCINLCIADTGITIYGSYVRTQKFIDSIQDEADALRRACEGYSTKERPQAENRGFGISTTQNLLVNGLGGAFFMLSGGAFHRYDENGAKYVNLPDSFSWDGTVILLRIPSRVPENFEFYKYIEQ